MKKTISAILVLCLALSLCACAKQKSAATADVATEAAAQEYDPNAYVKVIFADETEEILDLGTLPAMASVDTETYNSKYAGNRIEMATTVTKVELDYEMGGFVRVSFEGGWMCYIRKGTPVIDEIKRGVPVNVTATLILDATNLVGTTLYGATITLR